MKIAVSVCVELAQCVLKRAVVAVWVMLLWGPSACDMWVTNRTQLPLQHPRKGCLDPCSWGWGGAGGAGGARWAEMLR